jgi:hypothetical protein
VLADVCGLQAQVLEAALLGVRARREGARRGDIVRALNQDRSIVRSWLMRGTLHLVAADDLRWLVELLGPLFANANRRRHAQLGLDEDLKRRGIDAIRKILTESGPLTRHELVSRLGGRGIDLDRRTQAPIHLIQLAALQGVLCLGPDRAGESTYVLIDDWLARTKAVPREAALGELARRYVNAYGPASAADLAAWSGIPPALARTAIASAQAALVEVTVQGTPAFILKSRARESATPRSSRATVRLLPAFDTYLLGYRGRDLAVPAQLQRRLQRGGGWLHPSVVVDGRAVGAWQLRRSDRRGEVVVEPFALLSRPIRAGIAAEISDIGRFLQLSLTAAVKR